MAKSTHHRGLNNLASWTLSGLQLLHRMSRAVTCTPELDEEVMLESLHAWQAAWWVQQKTGGDTPSLLSWCVKAMIDMTLKPGVAAPVTTRGAVLLHQKSVRWWDYTDKHCQLLQMVDLVNTI